MNTILIQISNIDREELRLIIAALRDKRDQMLNTQEKERITSIVERRPTNTTVGDQVNRLNNIIDALRKAYAEFPMPKITVTTSQ